jgi:hypothetical protein
MDMAMWHQNTSLALRLEMGWPIFKPVNDCISFTAGRAVDFQQGLELGRIAQILGKDVIHSSWASGKAVKPAAFCVAYRELLAVDIIDRVVPFAANDDDRVILVSTRSDEHFAIDGRGSLVRVAGKPKRLGEGRKRAMKRIKTVASTLGGEMLASNRLVPIGGTVAPEVPFETTVRFG